jgi:Coenzyme PQQ synthesis protein D (PqqD)
MSTRPAGGPLLAPSDRFRLAADVRFRVVVEEGVVLRQESAEVLIVNPVGARLLDLVAPGQTLLQITDRLEEEFDVTREQLDEDVAVFLGELLGLGVIQRADADAPG